MAYTEVSLIIEGALSEEKNFYDNEELSMEEWIEDAKQDLAGSALLAQIYALRHDHDEVMEECLCAQFSTDHNPIWNNQEKRK